VAVPRFGLTSMIAATASSGAPTPSFAPVVAVQVRAPPPSDELASGSNSQWGMVLFIGKSHLLIAEMVRWWWLGWQWWLASRSNSHGGWSYL
jgi:hypothetical protein